MSGIWIIVGLGGFCGTLYSIVWAVEFAHLRRVERVSKEIAAAIEEMRASKERALKKATEMLKKREG